MTLRALCENFLALKILAESLISHPLSRKNLFVACLRVLKWQIGARLLNSYVVIKWVDRAVLLLTNGKAYPTGNIYLGLKEFSAMGFLLHALSPNDTFVDVGANVGEFSTLASRVIGSKSIAIEPLPDLIIRLNDQLSINHVTDFVTILPIAIGDTVGSVHLSNKRDSMDRVTLNRKSHETVEVSVSTLDSCLRDEETYFIKIDVEGYEWHVLNGARRILSLPNIVAVIIELNGSGAHFEKDDLEVHDILLKNGFTPISYDPLTRNVAILNGINRTDVNTIYVKDVELIMERIAEAPKRLIHTAGGIMI